jgi:hypothetical protein
MKLNLYVVSVLRRQTIFLEKCCFILIVIWFVVLINKLVSLNFTAQVCGIHVMTPLSINIYNRVHLQKLSVIKLFYFYHKLNLRANILTLTIKNKSGNVSTA